MGSIRTKIAVLNMLLANPDIAFNSKSEVVSLAREIRGTLDGMESSNDVFAQMQARHLKRLLADLEARSHDLFFAGGAL